MKIDNNDINLLCLKCSKFDGYALSSNTKMNSRIVYDYEIEFYTKSNGGIEINGVFVPFKTGSINFRKPGQIVRGVLPYSCYVISVDIMGCKSKISQYYDFGSADSAQPLYENELFESIPNKIESDNIQLFGTIIKNIYDNYIINNEFVVKTLLYQLFMELYNLAARNTLSPYPSPIQKSIKYIKANYKQNILIKDIAEVAGLSTNYFHNLFKKYVGIAPNQFISNIRIENAKILLLMTDMPVSKIGEECGIYDAVYFSYLFKKQVGVTAKEYRKNLM